MTSSYRLNGQTIFSNGGSSGRTLPPFFTNFTFIKGATGQGTALLGVDRDGRIAHWTPSLPSSGTSPDLQDLTFFRYVETGTADIREIQNAQPLFATQPMVNSKSLYDWDSINLASINRVYHTTHTFKVELEQLVFNTPRHMMALQLGWFREDTFNAEMQDAAFAWLDRAMAGRAGKNTRRDGDR